MTTSRTRTLVLVLVLSAVPAWPDTTPAAATTAVTPAAPATPATPAPPPVAPAGTTYPKDLSWALGEFEGEGDWRARLPLLLTRNWSTLPEHQLSEPERSELRSRVLKATLRLLDQQASQLILDLDKKRLVGPLPTTEPAATDLSLANLEKKKNEARGDGTLGDEVPKTLAFRAVWPPSRDKLPWNSSDGPTLVARASTLYAVTGSFRLVGGYLSVQVRLYSDLERRILSEWEGRFAADEAADRMAEASDHFREALLGRPWAGLVVTSDTETRVRVGESWHPLPWSSDDLEPGTVELTLQQAGRPNQTQTVVLENGKRTVLPWNTLPQASDRLVLETDPPGVSLYMDSRYLGPSPQTVDRPLATSRVRAQAPGWQTLAWEVGPATPSPSLGVLSPPREARSVPDAKDSFYLTLAAFSFSLTTSAFVGAWFDEQVQLTNAYATAYSANPTDQIFSQYTQAYNRAQAVRVGYAASVVLTSGVFVWMMFQLMDYLGTAQASLP